MRRRIPPWKLWSPSRLELILTCPLSYFFSYIIKLEPTPNIFGVFGTAIHEMTRKFFSLKNGFQSQETFIGAWRHYWWKEVLEKKHENLFKDVGRDKCGMFFAVGVKILETFFKENIMFRQQELRPIVEKNISKSFRGHHLSGRLDRIQPLANGKREISDYKSGLHKATEAEIADSIPFTSYNLLYLLEYGEDPEAMWLYYLSSGEKISVPLRKESDYLKLAFLLDEVTMYVKNIFQPSSDHPTELPISGLDPEDIKRRRFSERPGKFCNICNHGITCRGFQPNDSMLEDWLECEFRAINFYEKTEQLILSLKEVKNETATS